MILINCTCHPIFFDLFKKSTNESVISDYRQNKHHEIDMKNTTKGNHVEFYAEIIGKLVGSVRSGIRTFIHDVKQGRQMSEDINQTLSMENFVNFLMNESKENATAIGENEMQVSFEK